LQRLHHAERVTAAAQVVHGDDGAPLPVGGHEVLQQLGVGIGLRPRELEPDAGGGHLAALDHGPHRAQRAVDVDHRPRVEVDEEDLVLRQDRQPRLQRGDARAHVEGVEGVVRLGGLQQLLPAHLEGRQTPAHERLAAVHLLVAQVDDRLEGRGHLPLREELGEPVGAGPVEQGLGRQRQAVLVGELHGEQAGPLGVRQGGQGVLEALAPARAGDHHARGRDVLRRLVAMVLDLEQHGRTVRQESHAIGTTG
jgi:hypothetical protein